MQQYIKIFIIPYLYEAQHDSGDTSPIIRSLKLHWKPLVFHKWKVAGRSVGGRCLPDSLQQLFYYSYFSEIKPTLGICPKYFA